MPLPTPDAPAAFAGPGSFTLFPMTPTLARTPGAVGVPGPTSTGAPTGSSGADGTGGAAAPTGGSMMPFLMIGFVVMLLLLTVMGPRKEKKRREALMASLSKHDEVQTVGGIIGSIVEIKGDTVLLKVDESSNTRMRFAKSSIQTVRSSRGSGRPGEIIESPDATP